MRSRSSLAVLVTAAGLALSGCAGTAMTSTSASAGGAGVSAVVGFYPYEFVTARVGGPRVDVTNLTKPGGEPHDLELTPRQVGTIGEADLVVYSAGFQPAVDEAVEQQAPDRALDVMSVVEPRTGGHGRKDPHVWLDPVRLGTIAGAVADRLAKADPDGAEDYRSRAKALQGELAALDDDLRTGLATCQRREFITSHDAFGYLADAYDLQQVPIAGLSPDAEPSPRRLQQVAARAEAGGATTVFFEELVSPKVAEALAREVGATAEVLTPLEGPPEQGDYLTAMRADLSQLRTALGCR